MAVINEDYDKIRIISDCSETDGLINYLVTIINIKVSSDSEKKDLQVQMLVVLDFIKTKFGFLTIPEIREAFKMYVAKDFGHKEIYRTLDSIVVSDVLNCFVDFRGEKLRAYNQKKEGLLLMEKSKVDPIEVEKIMIDGVNNKYFEFLETNAISEPVEHIFKELIERRILKIPTVETPKISEYYDNILAEAKKQIESELKSETALSKKEQATISQELKNIVENNSSKAEIRAKKLVIIDFFTKQNQLGKKIIL